MGSEQLAPPRGLADLGKLSETGVVQGNAPHDRPGFLVSHLIGNRASFLCTKAPMLRGHDKVSGWHRISGRDVQAIFWVAGATTPSRRTARQLLRASLPEQPRQSLFFRQTCALWTNSATSGAAICALMSTSQRKVLSST